MTSLCFFGESLSSSSVSHLLILHYLILQIPRSGKKGSDGVTVVSYTHVREEALRMALQPIVYIDRLLRIDALDAVDDALYQDMWKDCCAMQYDAMLNNSHTSACREYRSLEMARF